MYRRPDLSWLYAVCVLVALSFAPARADELAEMRELRERVERLERQNQELQEKEANRNEEEGKNKQDGANAATDAAGKKPDAETKWVEVGSDLRLNGIWDNGLYFLTPNKDWKIHIGGRFRQGFGMQAQWYF